MCLAVSNKVASELCAPDEPSVASRQLTCKMATKNHFITWDLYLIKPPIEKLYNYKPYAIKKIDFKILHNFLGQLGGNKHLN